MPTELERRGDFSQSIDTNGQLIVVRDPIPDNRSQATSSRPTASTATARRC